MPFVRIKIAKGRTIDQKRTLVESVTKAIADTIGVDRRKVWLQIDAFELDNFAVDGRLMIDKS